MATTVCPTKVSHHWVGPVENTYSSNLLSHMICARSFRSARTSYLEYISSLPPLVSRKKLFCLFFSSVFFPRPLPFLLFHLFLNPLSGLKPRNLMDMDMVDIDIENMDNGHGRHPHLPYPSRDLPSPIWSSLLSITITKAVIVVIKI